MKKIAIVGGAGFIGSHLTNLYVKNDYSVYVSIIFQQEI